MAAELTKLSEAFEKENYIQIGNILHDELIPNFDVLEVEIGKTIDVARTRKNLN